MNPYIKPLSIGGVFIPNNVFLAPLAGYTDSIFRRICKRFGAGLVFTEMISIDALFFNSKKTLSLLEFKEKEKPIGIQLFGGHPDRIEKALRRIEKYDFDFVDFNAGCPVKKVIKAKAGSYHLKDLPLLRQMLSIIKQATNKPLTLKTRLGWDSQSIVIFDILEIAEDVGVEMLTIHTRTRSDGFSTPPRLDILKKVKEKSRIPIIGNGGIDSVEMANRYFEETGVDGIMIGRAAFEKPWIFQEIIEGRKIDLPIVDLTELMIRQLEHLKKEKGEIKATNQIKKFLAHYTKGLPHSTEFRQKVYHSFDFNELRNLILECKQRLM